MPKCKKCNKEFHAGLYADLPCNWEYEYCTDACWIASEEYDLAIEEWKAIGSYLENSELKSLRRLLEDKDFIVIGLSLLDDYGV